MELAGKGFDMNQIKASENATTLSPTATEQQKSIRVIEDAVQRASFWVQPLQREMGRVIVGQERMVHHLLMGLLANGHILIEGVTGLAKTLTLKSLAAALQTSFRRIQFTPDLTSSDVVGTEIFDPRQTRFEVKLGPVFGNFVLADDIDRAPARVRSALLQAMQERQVTLGERSFDLPSLFLVLATQNPVESEGNPSLSMRQADQFLLKTVVPYPSPVEERLILDIAGSDGAPAAARPVVSADAILRARKVARTLHVDDRIKDYIVSLVYATREPMGYGLDLDPYIRHGASPRATLSLLSAGRAVAFLDGRGYVTPHDIKEIAVDVLRHRIRLTYEAEAEGLDTEQVVRRILDSVLVP
jgi:MoxR-like ATPase